MTNLKVSQVLSRTMNLSKPVFGLHRSVHSLRNTFSDIAPMYGLVPGAHLLPYTTASGRPYKNSISPRLRIQIPRNRTFSSTVKMAASSKYPTRAEISERFEHLAKGEYEQFFKHVAQDVDWTVMGTHPCAGHYTSLKDFYEHTIQRLGAIMTPAGIKLKLRNVIGGGDQEWAVAELIADAECKNGLNFDNTYAWCCRFNEEGTIVQVRAYLDSTLVQQAVVENECPSHRAPTGR